jgi:3-oxoacyl-[acyl-carrier-protein] synthase II
MHRVVITGVGAITPLGLTADAFAEALLTGANGAGPITLFDAGGFSTRIAAQVPHNAVMELNADRKSSFALSLGLGLELFSMPDMVEWLKLEQGGANPRQVKSDFLQPPSDDCAHEISLEFGLTEPPVLHVSACAASTDAVGHAFRAIRRGKLDWALAGGADSMINPMGVAGFCKIQAMTTRNDAPHAASRPFDSGRDGFLLGEGAAMFVLESLDHAQARGACMYAEILGYGNSFDAYGISEPHPEGAGAAAAIRRALADAQLRPDQIQHVNAHGTSTPKNDPAETSALRAVLGEHIERVTVNATKSMIGHLIAASGAVELAAQIVCAARGYLHATLNLDHVDSSCRLNHLTGAPRRMDKSLIILKNSFAFGGQNACLALSIPCNS